MVKMIVAAAADGSFVSGVRNQSSSLGVVRCCLLASGQLFKSVPSVVSSSSNIIIIFSTADNLSTESCVRTKDIMCATAEAQWRRLWPGDGGGDEDDLRLDTPVSVR